VSPLAQRALLAAVALVATLAGFWAAMGQRQPAAPPAEVPDRLDFALPDLEGYARRVTDWRGNPLLINFWATWCPPCREEIPLLKRAQERHRANGLHVVGIAIDSEEAVAAFHRSVRFNYPVLIGEIDALGLLPAYGNPAGGLPFSVLLDAGGHIVHRKFGPYQETELEALLQKHVPRRDPRPR
jgi:thiol-disulfide isomerase/thioredoxin